MDGGVAVDVRPDTLYFFVRGTPHLNLNRYRRMFNAKIHEKVVGGLLGGTTSTYGIDKVIWAIFRQEIKPIIRCALNATDPLNAFLSYTHLTDVPTANPRHLYEEKE